jgi:hypothetical protein
VVNYRSDWVVTVDRNAGIEYFDSPAEGEDVFDAYVIDCVPDRGDLGNLRMVTSTTRLDEVRAALELVLDDMGIRYEPHDLPRMLRALKGLSGRMAMRLASMAEERTHGTDLVALAMLYEHLQNADESADMSLDAGFLVPLDDVPDLIGEDRAVGDGVRADMVFVGLGKRTGLTFRFLMVRHRRQLAQANDLGLLDDAAQRLRELAHAWNAKFFPGAAGKAGLVVDRARLVRVLHFYADKALRHALGRSETAEKVRARHERFTREIDALVTDLQQTTDAQDGQLYVFCPELRDQPRKGEWSDLRYEVFGIPRADADDRSAAETDMEDSSPDASALRPVTDSVNENSAEIAEDAAPYAAVAVAEESPALPPTPAQERSGRMPVAEARIVFGDSAGGDESEVTWTVSSKANPHLMMVGLSGMGKTEALLNIIRQMHSQNIVPIVLSYHADIDERMQGVLGDDVQLLTSDSLGYNPMAVTGDGARAYVDNAGRLRDGFAAIWPDLGEVQLNELRSAIKSSYDVLGWNDPKGGAHELPRFRDFFELLKRSKSTDKGLRTLLQRLELLDDYGIFSSSEDARSLLGAQRPTVLSLHESGDEMIQRAVTMLALHGVYTDMFQRGVQPGLTHAIIIDEAHRASKLKWLPRFAKEGRKFGVSLLLASQAATDFQEELFSGIASYLLLRMTERDAAVLAKAITASDEARRYADRLKRIDKYQALFFTEGQKPAHVRLRQLS